MLPMVGVRMSPESRKAVEAWADTQPDKPSLSEAIRRLVDRGLDSARVETAHASKPAAGTKTHRRGP
jgi:hypothetical protein